MRLFGQEFGTGIVSHICEAIGADEELTRSALSRQVCEWLDWRTPQGAMREMRCRKALVALEQCGEIALPPSRGRPGENASGRSGVALALAQARCTLCELGPVELVAVEGNSAQSRQWREMFDAYHPLKSGPLCGAQQRYLIHSERFGLARGSGFQCRRLAPGGA